MTSGVVGEIGLSLFIVTLDAKLESNAMRSAFIIGPPQTVKDFVYADKLTMEIPVKKGLTATNQITNVRRF